MILYMQTQKSLTIKKYLAQKSFWAYKIRTAHSGGFECMRMRDGHGLIGSVATHDRDFNADSA